MNETRRLLAEYARDGSEPAFRELVARYTDLVYSAAVRLVDGDTHLAQDVAQTVFVDLARLARKLPPDVMLGGWLHRHTCYLAATVRRGERRRLSRERQAVEMNALPDHSEANLARMAPILDEAINELDAEDRSAILLRFFEQRDFRAVGEALGSNEDAARMRVTRALEKLHVRLRHRGVALSAVALGAALASQGVTAAPAGLAAGLAATALASTAAGTGTLTLLKIMTMTKLKFSILSAVAVVAVAAPLVIQNQSARKLRQENQTLRQQVDQLAQLAAENQSLSNELARANSSRALAPDQMNELLKLRGEVGQLRRQSQELAKVQEENRQLRARPPVAAAGITPRLSPEVAQQYACINQLRQIDGAKQQFALEHGLTATNFVTAEQILPYLRRTNDFPRCPAGGVYTLGRMDEAPTCSIPGHVMP